MNPFQVRPIKETELNQLYDHFVRESEENGQNGDLIFSPLEEIFNENPDKFILNKKLDLEKSPFDINWLRIWILTNGDIIKGHLSLQHHVRLKSSLHRGFIMMGIEKGFRSKGYGSQLLEASINWSKKQDNLSWLNLNVFDHNKPALNLYKKFGFKQIGFNEDLFRCFGESVNDIEMSLNLNSIS